MTTQSRSPRLASIATVVMAITAGCTTTGFNAYPTRTEWSDGKTRLIFATPDGGMLFSQPHRGWYFRDGGDNHALWVRSESDSGFPESEALLILFVDNVSSTDRDVAACKAPIAELAKAVLPRVGVVRHLGAFDIDEATSSSPIVLQFTDQKGSSRELAGYLSVRCVPHRGTIFAIASEVPTERTTVDLGSYFSSNRMLSYRRTASRLVTTAKIESTK